MEPQRIMVWDLPIRLFHWLLAVLVTAAVITGKIGGGAIVWHGRIGLIVLGLLTFRIIWGFVGSTHARFASFIPTPGSVKDYLGGRWRGLGHNPLGAFSVFGLLALIGLQVGTGLVANDDIAFRGPLYALAGSDLSLTLTSIHRLSVNLLIALIVLHLAAILFYTFVKKERIVKPMIDGHKEFADEPALPPSGGGKAALIVALALACVSVYLGSGAWLAATPVPATAPAAPAW